MWTSEVMTRHSYSLLVIYRNGESMGSLQFFEGDEDLIKWQKLVELLNQIPEPEVLKNLVMPS